MRRVATWTIRGLAWLLLIAPLVRYAMDPTAARLRCRLRHMQLATDRKASAAALLRETGIDQKFHFSTHSFALYDGPDRADGCWLAVDYGDPFGEESPLIWLEPDGSFVWPPFQIPPETEDLTWFNPLRIRLEVRGGETLKGVFLRGGGSSVDSPELSTVWIPRGDHWENVIHLQAQHIQKQDRDALIPLGLSWKSKSVEFWNPATAQFELPTSLPSNIEILPPMKPIGRW